MKKILLFLAFLSILGSAQSHRFIYKYDFVADSLKPDNVSYEFMRLNITKDFSEFLPEKRAREDSIIMRNIALNKTFDMSFSANAMSNESNKDYHKNETLMRAEIGIQQVLVQLKNLPKWNLSSENKKIGGYSCQKATSSFGGRFWTAWFTMDLPFQEGPYIFKNLPGLVVELEDKTKSHHFMLIGNHNSKDEKSNRFVTGNVLTLSEEKFVTAWRKYRQNPVPPSLQMQNRGIIFNNQSDLEWQKSNEIEGIKKDLAKNNNPILLTLYK